MSNEGNQNAKGNKGGGRKSAYQEKADADLLYKMFFGDMDKEEILNKVKSGNYSLKDVFISKAFLGNEKILTTVFKKIFPDNVNLGGSANPFNGLNDEQLDEQIRELTEAIEGKGEETKDTSIEVEDNEKVS